MSSPSSSSRSHSLSNSDANAKVRVTRGRRQPKSSDNYKSANVIVSSRIYWKVTNRDATCRLQSLCGFRSEGSLELSRLKEGTWDEVKEVVEEDEHDGKSRITVHGRIQHRNLSNKIFPGSDGKIEIIPNAPEEHEVWLEKLRARIAPWDLLRRKMKDGCKVEELEKALGGSANSAPGTKLSSTSTDEVENKWRDKFIKLPEELQKLSIVDKLTAQGAAAVGLGGTLENLVAGAEQVTETAKFLGDLSKCIGGLSTVFQLVSLGAQGVSMCLEANRGQQVLPNALVQITILLRYVLESLTEIMIPSRDVKETAVDFVFDALKEAVSIMDTAETQLLRGRVSRIVHADDVKKVEEKIEELKQKAVIADNASRAAGNASRIAEIASKIRAMDEKVNRLEEERELGGDLPHHVRPSVSAFFSGRKKELKSLRHKLENWGSAVITQYGGAGKTELMIAFADRAERDEEVPGGVFWVTIDGDVMDVIDSLAGLAEKLTRIEMSEEDRRNGNLVIAALEQGLGEREGRWLLCMDNADDSEVGGILTEVCRLAEPSRGSGWVVVTSRQGQPHIWNAMKREQKLALKPLCVQDAMVALWRQIEKIDTTDADDNKVAADIKKLEGRDQVEYCALKKLCGDDGGQGLGGLPLALVQAGSFIAQFEYSFSKYLDEFESANKKHWENVMNKTEVVKPIEDSQRSIWTTWKISVKKLTITARTVLQAMAMLGHGGIGEAVVNGILKAVAADGGDGVEGMFQNIIMKELMHGSSLIWRDEGGLRGRRIYEMHRLVRRFILHDMVRGSALWNDLYRLALPAVREVVKTELEQEGKSFREFPDVFDDNHRELSIHTLALVHHYEPQAQGTEGCDVSGVFDIHCYTGMVMQFMGKLGEEAQVWKQLLTISHRQPVETQSRSSVEGFSDMPHHENHGKEVSHRYNKPYDVIGCFLGNLGNVYNNMGELGKALEKYEQSLEMYRAVHGQNKAHHDIASSLLNLGNVYGRMGELGKALEKCEQSLEMYRAVHGQNKAHHDIVLSLWSIGYTHHLNKNLDYAAEFLEQSLEMLRIVHGRNSEHPHIMELVSYLAEVREDQGRRVEALAIRESNTEKDETSDGEVWNRMIGK